MIKILKDNRNRFAAISTIYYPKLREKSRNFKRAGTEARPYICFELLVTASYALGLPLQVKSVPVKTISVPAVIFCS